MGGPTFAAADLARIEPVDLDSAGDIRSAHLIAHMAAAAGVGREAAAAVVDGFWDFVADVRGNYRYSSEVGHVNPRTGERISGARIRYPKAWLVIPHFGTFHVRRTEARRYPGLRLTFRSRKPEQGLVHAVEKKGGLFRRLKSLLSAMPEPKREPPPPPPKRGTGLSGSWAELAGRREDLSIKRRMALDTSRSSGLDLALTAELTDLLIKAVLAAFERAAREGVRSAPRIHWARRGVMLPDLRHEPPGAVYRFRCTPGFARRISEP